MNIRAAVLPSVALLVTAMAVLVMACATQDDAKSYMPEASELCCHGNWEVQSADGKPEEGSCGHLRQFDGSESCWSRTFANVRIRPGEAHDLQVWVAAMQDEREAAMWLTAFTPLPPGLGFEATEALAVGENSRMWHYREQILITEIAFTRERLAIVVSALHGTREQHEVMFESIDEALLDRIIGFR